MIVARQDPIHFLDGSGGIFIMKATRRSSVRIHDKAGKSAVSYLRYEDVQLIVDSLSTFMKEAANLNGSALRA
jgi:hypothetical protein